MKKVKTISLDFMLILKHCTSRHVAVSAEEHLSLVRVSLLGAQDAIQA